MIDQTTTRPESLITISPDWLGGTPCFAGLRVPVSALFDYLKAGQSLETFLSDYPGVTRRHAEAVIDLASSKISLTDAAE